MEETVGKRGINIMDITPLKYKLQFPVTAYVKENGFLGIVSYNEYDDDLLIASKSTLDSSFAQWLKEMLYAKVSIESINNIRMSHTLLSIQKVIYICLILFITKWILKSMSMMICVILQISLA